MKRQEWNKEQLEQLLQELPSVKDKQTAEYIYQQIEYKQQTRKKTKTWIAPTIATVVALFIFALISPFIFQNFSSNDEGAMDMASSSEESAKMENYLVNDSGMGEANFTQESTNVQSDFDKKALISEEQKTFVTSVSKSEETITVGFTDSQAQNILPISLEANKKREKLEQLEEINPEVYADEIGPITYELSSTEFYVKGNPEEINIKYHGEPNLTSSGNDMLYQNAIIETFRWHNYKKANLYTNNQPGIEFGNTGPKKDLEVKKENKKAYFLYQFNEKTLKILVPSPDPYDSVDIALDAMKQGLEERHLKPTIMNNIKTIRTKENGEQLEVEFSQDTTFENSEPTIIMLESILLTAKEFGFKTVLFKGMNIDTIGVMDVTKPIEVPFSPNPIEAN